MNWFTFILFVVIIYGLPLATLVFFAIKRPRLFMILLGIAAIVAAIPVGYIAEIGIAGCCGAPSNGREGLGFFLGGVLGCVGVGLLLFSNRFKKPKAQKKPS